ncbi:MAG: HPr kinase/phosphorylase [Alphaproteobacteria bacterium]
MSSDASLQLHATCIAWEGVGVLLRGPSGGGKSDLALRAIGAGAELVADDRVELLVRGGALIARPPAALAGLLEVRGIGIVRLPYAPEARLGVVADLVPAREIDRLPAAQAVEFLGFSMPRWALAAFEASAVDKLRLMVRARQHGIIAHHE